MSIYINVNKQTSNVWRDPYMNYKRVRRGLTVEMFFQTGKALIPSRTHNWQELLSLVETIPVPRRGV